MEQGKKSLAIMFLLDNGFGAVRNAWEGKNNKPEGIDLFPSVSQAIAKLKDSKAHMVLATSQPAISHTVSRYKLFLPFIEKIIPFEKDIVHTVSACRNYISSSLKTRKNIFVSIDRVWRGAAAKEKFIAVPHASIAALLAEQSGLVFAHITGKREYFNHMPEAVPYFLEHNQDNTWSMLAVLSKNALTDAVAKKLDIKILPLDMATEDPVFIENKKYTSREKDILKKCNILLSGDDRFLAALHHSTVNDSLDFPGHHGHIQYLMPRPELLQSSKMSAYAYNDESMESISAALASEITRDHVLATRGRSISSIWDYILSLIPSTPATFLDDIEKYGGVSNLDSSGPVSSRHILHPDNARVVQALLDELNGMGYCAYTHSFNHSGMTLHNVIADLPGAGYLRFPPSILEKIREIFLRHPLPDPPDPWIREIENLIETKIVSKKQLRRISPLLLRTAIETVAGLKPYYPWWLKCCRLPGFGAKIVLVGGHLDSTASRDAGYNPSIDPAPGMDDNASGMASTLALARYTIRFSGQLTHTVRFCFFNAEEQGMVGSKAYAALLKASNAPIKATVCMDMLGFNSDENKIFEIHAGYTDPAVRDLSVPIAELIANKSLSLGSLPPAQVFTGTIANGGTDPDIFDGAINRSDHASFHEQGYAAVTVGEDFFANPPGEPVTDPNPNYHRASDTVIDSTYGSSITCALAFAVKDLAQ